ncbi:MAG TPA: LLM class flavin-dependent oxidoreductase [Chloroflexota bacterium]|nr:LLM class flavin-dependent oxidoreductase [Chloroflexota bacterium]
MRSVRFSIFDWLDESGRGMGPTYEERLKMLEFADRAGYYCYHLAEHHGSELSTTPSPNVFLSAVAQRARRMRLGALTYLLPLYNPLRLLEEICMLDQLSGGRLEMGVSRGSSAFEGERFGVLREEARPMFEEALDIILMGLSSGVLDYHGQYFQYDRLTTRLRPYQRPYPPLWYPTSNPDSVPWLASQGFSTIFGVAQHPTFGHTQQLLERYRDEYEAHRADANRRNGHVTHPNYGFTMHVYVAQTDEIARSQARPAYAAWFDNFTRRYVERGQADRWRDRGNFDQLLEQGQILVGSPATVRDRLERYLELSEANYVLGAFAFGNLTLEQIMTSLDLFAREVIPALSAPQNVPV